MLELLNKRWNIYNKREKNAALLLATKTCSFKDDINITYELQL